MRRRRSRYTWFPILGTEWGESQQSLSTTWQSQVQFDAIVPGRERGNVSEAIAIPLLSDEDIQADAAGSQISLRDRVEGKDYAVERIVGKVWGACAQFEAQPEEVIVTSSLLAMAIAVLPVEDETGNPSMPEHDYNPIYADNSGQPWMWRRTWHLTNNLGQPSSPEVGEEVFTGPAAIGQYGSALDAGHVDVKSVRRVTREQRLFFIVAAQILDTSDEGALVNTFYRIKYGYDLRVLGAMRRARNTSTFK